MPTTTWFQGAYRSTQSLTIALDQRDAYTRQHCDRVVILAGRLGSAMGLDDEELAILDVCAAFHDIGKIGIPDSVLYKPDRYTDAEWEVMKTHAELGEQILHATQLPSADRISRIIRHHHENFAGDGYPDGLSGDDIPLLSRIILIVDAYDAMRTRRPHSESMSHKQVMSVLESENGWKFDPDIFREFTLIAERIVMQK